MSRTIDNKSTYTEKLVKLIPVEIVGAYLAIQNLVMSKPEIREITLYSTALILAVLIPFYLRIIHQIKSWLQIAMTIVTFFVWIFSISVWALQAFNIDPVWGSVVLILWTTVIPVLQFKELRQESAA